MKTSTTYICEHCGREFLTPDACESHEFNCMRMDLPEWIKPGVLAFDTLGKTIYRIKDINIEENKVAVRVWWDQSITDDDWIEYETTEYVALHYREVVIDRHAPDTLRFGEPAALAVSNSYTVSRIDSDETVVLRSVEDTELEIRVPLKKLHRLVGSHSKAIYQPLAASVQYKDGKDRTELVSVNQDKQDVI
jgi:hypothetical protein